MVGEKIFYSIAEVSEQTDLPKYVIRFWETEFAEISPDRRQGRRYYRQSDIDMIMNIKDLLYKKGYTIKGAKKYLHDKKGGAGKVFSDFQMDEKTKTLEPIQDSKILKRFNFSAPSDNFDDAEKVDIKSVIQKLGEIEDILSE